MASITWWCQEIVEIVCMFEELLMIFIDLHIHLLIHLLDEVELVRVFSCCWIFFLERYMKKLKVFFQQRDNGSMEERYILYEYLYYAMSTSSKLKTHQVQKFGVMKGMKTKEKGRFS